MGKKVCMSYNEFMSKAKSAGAGYTKKANIGNNDAKPGSGKAKETATGPIKGNGTPSIQKLTNQHLSNIKSKDSVRKPGTKK
jgi:hypothetical protein